MDKKKVGICTLYGNHNFGNKLQNYALQKVLMSFGVDVETFKLDDRNIKSIILDFFIKKKMDNIEQMRYEKFLSFNNKINYSKKKINMYYPLIKDKIEIMFYGSDQVWNPNLGGKSKLLTGNYGDFKKISYAASFGINNLTEKNKKILKKGLEKFTYISVREESGKKIASELVNRSDIEVVIDPTMLLDCEEWDKISKKPKELNYKKYTLMYFLGEISLDKKEEIKRIAKENDCEIINILDKNDPFYISGPSEFLYLEKNAFLICTDSFHSAVFAILYNRPFIIFERTSLYSMYSRIDTLLSKFQIENRKYNGKSITKDNLNHDYKYAYAILDREREKSIEYIKKSINI